MKQGTVEWRISSRGNGIILGDDGEPVAFFDSDCDGCGMYLRHGDRVEYALARDAGGIKAIDVHKVQGDVRRVPRR